MDGTKGVTFELQLRFLAEEAGAATKQAVLAELARRGVTSIADGVVDGVDVALGDDDAGPPSFDDEDATPILVFDRDQESLARLGEDLVLAFPGRLATRLTALPDEAWSQAWDEEQVALATRRFFVSQGEAPASAPAGLVPLRLVPGTAFGSGRHATTQVALEAIEDLPAEHPRGGFLDVGTGTGVLALAAARLGFTRIVGTDIDADVLDEARRNAALNGAVLDLRLAAGPPTDEGRFAVVASNILVPVLHHLLPQLVSLLAPDGSLLLAGFIEKEAGPLLVAAERQGLRLAARHECRGWVGLTLVADPAARA